MFYLVFPFLTSYSQNLPCWTNIVGPGATEFPGLRRLGIKPDTLFKAFSQVLSPAHSWRPVTTISYLLNILYTPLSIWWIYTVSLLEDKSGDRVMECLKSVHPPSPYPPLIWCHRPLTPHTSPLTPHPSFISVPSKFHPKHTNKA